MPVERRVAAEDQQVGRGLIPQLILAAENIFYELVSARNVIVQLREISSRIR